MQKNIKCICRKYYLHICIFFQSRNLRQLSSNCNINIISLFLSCKHLLLMRHNFTPSAFLKEILHTKV